jgi:catechol-2,3-dioxygenase
MRSLESAFLLPAIVLFVAGASAQVVPPNSAGVSMGHLHLNSADPEVQRKFWVDILGARPAKLGPADVYVIPGALIMVSKKPQKPEPTEGSVVNHVGVRLRDYEACWLS